jgi:hypothetical protein
VVLPEANVVASGPAFHTLMIAACGLAGTALLVSLIALAVSLLK